MQDRIEQEIVIEAPVDVVWRVLTEPAHLERWFADHAELDARPGAPGLLVFEPNASRTGARAPLEVVAVEPHERFAYRWSHPEGERPTAENSALVEFVLEPHATGTRLRVIESGISSLPGGDARREEYLADHTRGWAHFAQLISAYASTVRAAAVSG